MKELDKLLNSLKILDRICCVNYDLGVLQRRIENLPESINMVAQETIKQHPEYLPSIIDELKKKIYNQFYDEYYGKINLLNNYKQELFNKIITIQDYPPYSD